MDGNMLFYGDNLNVMVHEFHDYFKDESVDLIYLDPPFNSNANYNVLFREEDGTKPAAQMEAFTDSWHWDTPAAKAYAEVTMIPGPLSEALQAFRKMLGTNPVLAYLTMMAIRLTELHRVLKSTGSIYLHCDPTASHYLKILMDAVFGHKNYVNEIIWKRTSAHADAKQGSAHFGRLHDTILFYAKSVDTMKWFPQYTDHDPHYVESHYRHADPDGRRFRWDNLTGPGGAAKGNPRYEVLGVMGFWRYSREKMADLIEKGLVAIPPKGTKPALKRYLDKHDGTPVGTIWSDIPPINSQAQERLGYPTQKPEALLDRILKASSSEGDTVLDPFCGCGTTVAAAQKLNRRWIGIDITYLAITLIEKRLSDAFGEQVKKTYNVFGAPADLKDAEKLAARDPYQFQFWALSLVNARPAQADQKKGADKGIDGRLNFQDEAEGGDVKKVIISVKAGHTTVAHIRDLRGVLDREKAQIGVLITMQESTEPMRVEAASAGFYESPGWKTKYPRIQILTIAELFAGKTVQMPPERQTNVTFKAAPKAKAKSVPDAKLPFE